MKGQRIILTTLRATLLLALILSFWGCASMQSETHGNKVMAENVDVKILPQPLRSKDSVATFDLILSNKGAEPLQTNEVGFHLKTTEQDCGALIKAVENADASVTLISLDEAFKEIGPMAEKTEVQFYNQELCANVQIKQPISIGPKATKRIKVDVLSGEARRALNKYMTGMGDSGPTKMGVKYVQSARFMTSDLRYYIVESDLKFGSGEIIVKSKMRSGEFEQDAQTVKAKS